MFWKVLKTDLKRNKTTNVILFMVSVLCAVFITGSVNTFVMTNRALAKFAEMSGTADYYMYVVGDADIAGWARNSELVTDYEEISFLRLQKGDIWFDGDIFWNNTTEPLLTMPSKKYNHVFDEDDNIIASVNDGECCIPRVAADRYKIAPGDTLEVTISTISRRLTVAHITKDYAFGAEYMMFDRILVGEKDYEDFVSEAERMSFRQLCLGTIDTNHLINEIKRLSLLTTTEWPGSLFADMYYLENMILQTIPVVSVLLIVISLSLFRFSIRAVIEDDYREIGAMKAVGVANSGVRRVYTAKYLAISLVGTVLGTMLSMPFGTLLGDLMTEKLRQNMVINNAVQPWELSVICAVAIVMITMLLIRLAAGRVNRISAIQAIRRGSSGRKLRKRRRLHLKGKAQRGVTAPFFMARNDIISSLRGYMIIFVTLAAGLLLTILSHNVLSTITDDKTMLPYLGIGAADAYAYPAELYRAGNGLRDYDMVIDYVTNLERQCSYNGVNIKVNGNFLFASKVYGVNDYNQISAIAWKQTNDQAAEVICLKGMPPVLTNEIAITETLMKQLNVRLGDKVHMCFGEDDREYIITASFELLISTGDGVILSPKFYPDMNYCYNVNYLRFAFGSRDDIGGQIKKLKETLPELDFFTADEITYQLMGNTIDSVKWMIGICVVLGMVMTLLVVFLISHTLLAKDSGAIALLKSLGFSQWSLRLWQTARIATIALTAALFAVMLSFPLTPMISKIIFGAVGAENLPPAIRLTYIAGVFPGMLIVTAVSTAWFVSRGVKRIDKRGVSELK
ncbi:MAG: ABC transporter permease [Peptococcaceae bacterium]|nr:ABC transporter permease [Peptococcaceae bacterium]